MTREFVMMPEFDRQRKQMGVGDEELRQLQDTLLQNPKAGVVVKGTGGRVAYVDFMAQEIIYLITAYPKNEKDNLSKKERNDIAKLITKLEQGIEGVKK